MKKIEQFKLPFPPYDPTKSNNSVVIIITDETIYDEVKDVQVGTVAKTQADADSFMVMIHGLCKTNGFHIDGSGTREQMAGRLYRKNGQNLMTETEVLEFVTDLMNTMIVHPTKIPRHSDVTDWIEKRNKRREEDGAMK